MSASLTAGMTAVSSGVGALSGVLAFLVWVVVLVWIYNIARRKGRHAVGWLILGMFFSLITLLIVLLLPSKRTTDSYSRPVGAIPVSSRRRAFHEHQPALAARYWYGRASCTRSTSGKPVEVRRWSATVGGESTCSSRAGIPMSTG